MPLFLCHSCSGHFQVYCLPPVPEPNQSLVHQTDNLLASITMATHQDEDGDTYVDLLKITYVGSLGVTFLIYNLLMNLSIHHISK